MSQGLALGITVGASNTVAVTTSGGQRRLHIGPSTLGSEPEVPESFLSRVGDPVDIRTRDGSAVRAADLVAAAVGRAVDTVTRAAGPAAATVACYPAWWTQHTVEVQRTALLASGLDSVALVPEPMAAMRWLQEVHESSHDGAMVVYDLGATGLTVSVVRTGALSGLLGEPVRTSSVSGSEFDLLTMRYVLDYAIGERDFDPFDPAVEQELSTLRIRCKNAKESLSKNTATVVSVRLPALGATDVRLVRDDVEELFRGPLLKSTELVREALRRAGVSGADLDGFLLTGGGASIPLVTELLSTEFGIPVAAAADPAHLSAHGAALLAADLLADITETQANPAIVPAGAHAAPALAENHEPADIGNVPAAPSHSASVALPERTVDEVPPVRTPTPALPTLPTEAPPTGFRHWKRVAVIGAAALAVAAVATGTLAMGTGAQSAPANTVTPQATSTTAAAAAPTAPGTVTTQPAAPGQPAATTKATQPGNGKPGTTTVAAAPGAAAPGGQANSPAPQQNPAGDQQPANPAPAPANPAPANPAPAPVQTVPAPQLPTFQQPTVPTVQVPVVPGLLNGLGNTVGSVPDQIVPHTGG